MLAPHTVMRQRVSVYVLVGKEVCTAEGSSRERVSRQSGLTYERIEARTCVFFRRILKMPVDPARGTAQMLQRFKSTG